MGLMDLNHPYHAHDGFTLIELLISIFLTLMLWGSLTILMKKGFEVKKDALILEKDVRISQTIRQIDRYLMSQKWDWVGMEDDIVWQEGESEKHSMKEMISQALSRWENRSPLWKGDIAINYLGALGWRNQWTDEKPPLAMELILKINEVERRYLYRWRRDDK